MNDMEKQRRAKAEAEDRRREHEKRMKAYIKGLDKYQPKLKK